MFTGIISELGEIVNITTTPDKTTLSIKNVNLFSNTKINDSIAVNGCCLTVVNVDKYIATFDVLPETINCSNLGFLKVGQKVNLEEALTLQSKLGGHIVQGHIDCRATISDITTEGDSFILTFILDKKFLNMIIPKAFICIDGISLTVMKVTLNADFSVMVIPHTKTITTAQTWQKGTIVNIEIDIVNKTIFDYLNNLDFLANK